MNKRIVDGLWWVVSLMLYIAASVLAVVVVERLLHNAGGL